MMSMVHHKFGHLQSDFDYVSILKDDDIDYDALGRALGRIL